MTVFINKQPLLNFRDPDFHNKLKREERISAIFWAALSTNKQPEELPRSAINFLVELDKTPAYIAAFVKKYLPRSTTNAASFFKVILEKEGDPLSQTDVENGQHLIEQGKNLFEMNPDLTGLNMINKVGKTFNIFMGTKIEECEQVLNDLKIRYEEFRNL